jgi:hypothetical protein
MFGNGENLSSEELEDLDFIIERRRRQNVLTSKIETEESINDERYYILEFVEK